MSSHKQTAEATYAKVAGIEETIRDLEARKPAFEADAKAAREEQEKAKASVAAARVAGDEASAAAFRKTRDERGSVAEELEDAAKQIDLKLAEARKRLFTAKIEAETAGNLAAKELYVKNMQLLRPLLSQLVEVSNAHDALCNSPRPGSDRYSWRTSLRDLFVEIFADLKFASLDHCLKKFDDRLASLQTELNAAATPENPIAEKTPRPVELTSEKPALEAPTRVLNVSGKQQERKRQLQLRALADELAGKF